MKIISVRRSHRIECKMFTLLVIALVWPVCTIAQRDDDYRRHHHHHHHHNRHQRLRSYAKPSPWERSRDSVSTSDRVSSFSSGGGSRTSDVAHSSAASSNSAICRREFLRPLEKRIADCDTIFTGTVERIYRSQLSPSTEESSPFSYLNSISFSKPHSEALTSPQVDAASHRPPEMMTWTSNLRRNGGAPFISSPSAAATTAVNSPSSSVLSPFSSEIQAEQPIQSFPRESRVRTPAYTRGGGSGSGRIHPLLLAQYRQQQQREQETMRGFTRRNSLTHPHQVARQRSQRAETFALDSHLATTTSSETYRALIRVKRIIKGDKSIQGKRIIIEGFGSDKICLSNVNERESKIFFTSSSSASSAMRMKLNSSLLSFTNDNLRKCVVAAKAATVKMNRLSPEKAVERKASEPLTFTRKTNVLMNEENVFSTMPSTLASTMTTTSFNKSEQVAGTTEITAPAAAASTEDDDASNRGDKPLVSAQAPVQINKSTFLITDESLRSFKSNLTDESLNDNQRRNHHHHQHTASAIARGGQEGISDSDSRLNKFNGQNNSSKYSVSSAQSNADLSDIDFLTDGDIMCPVKCNSIGSLVPISCDPLSKHCRCKPGVTGVQCDACESNHWGFHLIVDENGSCQACNCNPLGSLHGNCTQGTGDCECKSGVFGSKCDSCPPGKTLSESGCIPSVTDDYNRLISSSSSDVTVDTSITTSSMVSRAPVSNIDDDGVKLNSFGDETVVTVNAGSKKKRKKGLGKKKNRKKKKVKPANLLEMQPPQ